MAGEGEVRQRHHLVSGLGMAALLAASMRGAQVAMPSNAPRLRAPAYVAARETPRNIRRRLKVAAIKRRSAQQDNARNRAANLQRRFWHRDREGERVWQQRVISKMTNHERNLWARAGYPVKKEEFQQYAHAAIYRATGEVVLS